MITTMKYPTSVAELNGVKRAKDGEFYDVTIKAKISNGTGRETNRQGETGAHCSVFKQTKQ